MGCNSYPYLAKWCNLNIIIGNLLCIEIWKALKNEKARQVIQFLYLHSRAEVWLHFFAISTWLTMLWGLILFFSSPFTKRHHFLHHLLWEIYSINKYFWGFWRKTIPKKTTSNQSLSPKRPLGIEIYPQKDNSPKRPPEKINHL